MLTNSFWNVKKFDFIRCYWCLRSITRWYYDDTIEPKLSLGESLDALRDKV